MDKNKPLFHVQLWEFGMSHPELLSTTFFLAFLPIKLLAYILWSYVGISYLKLNVNHPKLRAVMYGLFRLLTGLLFGMALAFLALMIFNYETPIASGIIAYLAVYLPVRWLEWSILEFIMNPKSRSFDFFVFGVNKFSRRWRLGGLVLCGLFDVPFIIMTGGAGLGNIGMC